MAALTLFLALLLVVSALHKGAERDRLAAVTVRLARVPLALGGPLLLLSAMIELLAALALVLPQLRVGGALAAAALWSVYALALFARRGEVLDCGCDLVAREKPVGAFAIARPALLAALALVIAGSPVAAWTIDAPFAGLALLALWFAAVELSVLPSLARSRQ